MKVSLVVSQGVHQGKTIPIPVAQFLIGRDEGCQLRPSSPAISKRHCAILLKSGKVFLRDFGSTNGTFVNDVPVSGEVEVTNDDKLKVGPLEFVLRLEKTGTTPPASKPEANAVASRNTPPPKDEPTKEQTVAGAKSSDDFSAEHTADQIAAMLLATDDGPGGPLTEASIPTGSTVFEVPAMGDPNAPPEAKKVPVDERDNSKRAADILKKYMQRPRQT
jgi:predicted component of type VI protein secretion system